MTHEEIKRHRVESVLKEIIPSALATLDDPMINMLNVTDVVCSKGRSDARVYLDKTLINEDEQKVILKNYIHSRHISKIIVNRLRDGLKHHILLSSLIHNSTL
ncbi:Ribosome-binding factor A [sediment metagenome]|uniref:Ribosome-binding factor A n=1 Tax=sediment metagenome TaxID=749907 RepID=D9PKF9_9ZZZZ